MLAAWLASFGMLTGSGCLCIIKRMLVYLGGMKCIYECILWCYGVGAARSLHVAMQAERGMRNSAKVVY
jgi:hypothetical protein